MWNPFAGPSHPSRWTATRAAARLGIIAGTLSGLALAFHLGGRDGYTVPLVGLLGMPTNVLGFGILRWFIKLPQDIVSSAGPASTWNLWRLWFAGSVALNWTLIGVAADLTRPRDKETVDATDVQDRDDDLLPFADPLRSAFDELERKVHEREPKSTASRLLAATPQLATHASPVGATALHVVAAAYRTDIAKELVDLGADVSARNRLVPTRMRQARMG